MNDTAHMLALAFSRIGALRRRTPLSLAFGDESTWTVPAPWTSRPAAALPRSPWSLVACLLRERRVRLAILTAVLIPIVRRSQRSLSPSTARAGVISAYRYPTY